MVPQPKSNVEIKTSDRSEVGLAFRRKLTTEEGSSSKTLDTPAKTIPASKLYDENQVSDEVRGANEFYAEVSTNELEELRSGEEGIYHQGLEEQTHWSREEEFNFTFLEYTDAHQISDIEAYQMVGILAQYSDFLTVPRQKKLYSKIDDENGLDDGWYQKFRNGTEFFLQACREQQSRLPIMGAIPPLDLIYLEDLINLYELYDVFAFYMDFNWDNHPTKPNQVARMEYLMRRIRNQRIHDDVLFYALNARRGDFDEALGFTPAADFATVTQGIDIVGGNHATPDWPEEVFEQIERNSDFHVFRPEIVGYVKSPIDRLVENIPETTTLDVQNVVEESASSDTTRRKYQKILNSELQAFDLAKLRAALEEGTTEDYLDERHVADEFLVAGETVREAFEEGAQATLGEWT